MSRLTISICENDEGIGGYNYKTRNTNIQSVKEVIDKLGKLEDLEEDLGFSLEKLSEKECIYADDYENGLRKYEIMGVNFKEKKIWFWGIFVPRYLEFKDYKQNFWFKEDRSE